MIFVRSGMLANDILMTLMFCMILIILGSLTFGADKLEDNLHLNVTNFIDFVVQERLCGYGCVIVIGQSFLC